VLVTFHDCSKDYQKQFINSPPRSVLCACVQHHADMSQVSNYVKSLHAEVKAPFTSVAQDPRMKPIDCSAGPLYPRSLDLAWISSPALFGLTTQPWCFVLESADSDRVVLHAQNVFVVVFWSHIEVLPVNEKAARDGELQYELFSSDLCSSQRCFPCRGPSQVYRRLVQVFAVTAGHLVFYLFGQLGIFNIPWSKT